MRAKLNALATAFERLSGREQGMVLFLSLAIIGIIFGFGGFLVNRDLNARHKRIEATADKLKEIAELRGDYQRRLADQNRLAAEVKGNANIRILSYLEDLARKASIDLGNAAERPGSATGSEQVKEEAAEVMIQNVSLDRLYEFLRQIEQGNPLVKVRQLKIRTRFDDKTKLDASVTVGTFKPTAGG
jgi:general secretion pathway protein M